MPIAKPTAPAPITPVPTPVPTRADRPNFAVRGDLMMAWFPGGITGINLVVTYSVTMMDYIQEQATFAQQAVTDTGLLVGTATTQAGIATAAAQTALNAPGTSSTSTTSLTIGAGTQTFTTQTGKAWAVGQPVVIARTSAAATTYMQGTVTAYNSGTGAMSVAVASGATGGTGTFTDWTISLTGPRGAAGSRPLVPISTNTTATAGNHYQFMASCVLTLPTSPAVNDVVQFSNQSGTVTASVDPGAELINGTSGAMTLNRLTAAAELKYSGATKGWIF